MRLSETVEPRRLSRSEVYGDLLRPSGFVYGIAIGIPTGRGQVIVAGLGRREQQFSERDRDVLDLVRPGPENPLQAAETREAPRPRAGSESAIGHRVDRVDHVQQDLELFARGGGERQAGDPRAPLQRQQVASLRDPW